MDIIAMLTESYALDCAWSIGSAISFGSDSPAVYLFLRIVHHCYQDIPSQLSLIDLSQLALLVDQFDCADVLAPWSNGWLGYLVDQADYDPTKLNLERWAFISNVFIRIEKARDIMAAVSRAGQSRWSGSGREHQVSLVQDARCFLSR